MARNTGITTVVAYLRIDKRVMWRVREFADLNNMKISEAANELLKRHLFPNGMEGEEK